MFKKRQKDWPHWVIREKHVGENQRAESQKVLKKGSWRQEPQATAAGIAISRRQLEAGTEVI